MVKSKTPAGEAAAPRRPKRAPAETAPTWAEPDVYSEALLNSVPIYICVLSIASREVLFFNAAIRRDFPRKAQRNALKTRLEKYIDFERELFDPFSLEVFPGRCLGVSGSRIVWKSEPALFLCSQELSDRHQEEYLHHVSYIDRLTQLPNRYRCELDLEIALAEAARAQKTGYMLLLDMDDFKVINDGYGHDYGDALLVEFAEYLSELTLPGDLIFRFGGDEFVMLVAPSNSHEIHNIVSRMLERARQPWDVLDQSFYCTISVGAAAFPDGQATVKEIIKNADVAMYEAKRYGKNSFALYTAGTPNDSLERAEMERLMRECISSGFDGFSVHYQPLISLKSNQIIGVEALIRWQYPDGSVIPPENFIALAEYLGLIVDLGAFILRKSAKLLRRINEALPAFHLSVNISIRQFQQGDFLEQVEAIIEDTGINPENLILEITEGLAATDMTRIQDICGGLHEKGIRIAMDDFGTGYSSLRNMRDVPYDIIKIDRDFIQNANEDSYAASFIRLITDFGHSVSKSVCIEGVETKEQYSYCKDAGADCIQGFYCYEPLPEAELLKLFDL